MSDDLRALVQRLIERIAKLDRASYRMALELAARTAHEWAGSPGLIAAIRALGDGDE